MKAGKFYSNTIYFYACVGVIGRQYVKFRQFDPKQNETILFQTGESACKMSKLFPALGTRFTV